MPPARRFLILHGWGGSGPGHWQAWLANWLQTRGESVSFPSLPDPDDPRCAAWLAVLDAELSSVEVQRIVIAHSLAVLLWLHHAQNPQTGAVDRLLLVAPPGPSVNNPQVETFFPPPRDPDALWRSAREILLVCSDNDPFCPERAAEYYGEVLAIPTLCLPPETGHINTASGFGPWPWVADWCLGTGPSPIPGQG